MSGQVFNQQPNGNPGMNTSGAPIVVIVPEREWKKGLLAAGNPFTALCWYSCLCSCFAQQRNYNRYQYIVSGGADNTINLDSEPVGGCCLVQGAVCHFFALNAVLPCILRQKIREVLRIRGSPVKDFAASVLCMPNVIAQSTLELQNEVTKLRVYGLSQQRPLADAYTEAQEYQLTAMPPPAYHPPE